MHIYVFNVFNKEGDAFNVFKYIYMHMSLYTHICIPDMCVHMYVCTNTHMQSERIIRDRDRIREICLNNLDLCNYRAARQCL